MFHASPFGAPTNQFVEGSNFQAQEFAKAYLATSHLLKDMGVAIFGAPARFLSLGSSTGVQRGSALIAGSPQCPFRGFPQVAIVTGTFTRDDGILDSYKNHGKYVFGVSKAVDYALDRGLAP